MKRLSIGMRLTLWYLAIFALAQLVFGAGMWLLLRHHLNDMVEDSLEDQIDDLRALLQNQGPDPSLDRLRREAKEAYSNEHLGNYLQVENERGEVIYRSDFMQQHPLGLTAPSEVDRPVFVGRRFQGEPFRLISEKIQVNAHTYTIAMAVPNDDVIETLSRFRTYLLMFAPIVLLLAAGGGYWLSRRALSPVDALVSAARDISGVNFKQRVPKLATGDELQRLSDTLNEMLDRIEAAFLRITEFTADASHELRTPVSLIRTEAELALRRSRNEEEYQASLRNILVEAERTTALIEQLLALARADSGRETLQVEPVNLSGTLRALIEGWRQVARIRDVQFSAEIPDDVFVLGDAPALRRVADLLLDNAFKYTMPPGSVRLGLQQQGESAVLSVKDSGSGIAEEEQSKIFERFYRADKARGRDPGGAGLGLAIARWIVTQHHGSISVESKVGEGSIFRVELPLVVRPVQKPLPA
jgi:heavy metal sensor kinase